MSSARDQHAPPATAAGLSLAPFRAARFTAAGDQLGRYLSPPYDVIAPRERTELLAAEPENIVGTILPQDAAGKADYAGAALRLNRQVDIDVLRVDPREALYVYELATADSTVTRGLIGAVELQPADAGVIFPHEDTMAGPVADRLALMESTSANLEPIYLIYDGGGPASDAVSAAAGTTPLASATTPDGTTHRLWAITEDKALAAIAADLAGRTAVIADGHHRYATYLELQKRRSASEGAGPWDRGLTLLVDTSSYGPQVEAIHRVVPGLKFDNAVRAHGDFTMDRTPAGVAPANLLAVLPAAADVFAAILTDGANSAVVMKANYLSASATAQQLLDGLDTTVVHRDLVGTAWSRPDTAESVLYAHSIDEALELAASTNGVAILLRPTPVQTVLDIARAGLRMPRKSTLFVPKPASGMVIRRFADAAAVTGAEATETTEATKANPADS